MKITYIILLGFLFNSCDAQRHPKLPQSKDSNTLLWEITGNGLKKPSYMFGTFHMMCKEDIVFSENLKKALIASKDVYFEMDLDDAKNTLGGIFFMNMKDKTLKDLYTSEEYKKLATFFNDSLRINIASFSKMKPMMLEAFLFPRMMPCSDPSGVEMELMAIAIKNKKEIKGFETIEFQSSIFDSIPYETQAKALLKDIDSTASYRVYFNKMVDVYKKQETEKLLAIIADTSFSDGENSDLMLKNRNVNWVKQLKKIMPDTNIFMGVGAAHLFGKDGLIALLKKEGYLVKGIKNN
jgi:uncharacterized protein